jgi:hypothetical protein
MLYVILCVAGPDLSALLIAPIRISTLNSTPLVYGTFFGLLSLTLPDHAALRPAGHCSSASFARPRFTPVDLASHNTANHILAKNGIDLFLAVHGPD